MKKKRKSPWFFPVLSFVALIIAGAIILMLIPLKNPSNGRMHLSFIDALFMATSAACVTGLSVIDIGSYFSFTGQLVILTLIQIGGLGITAISTVLLTIAGRSISIRSRFILQDTFTHSPQSDILNLIKRVIAFTVIIEIIGAIPLFIIFFGQSKDILRATWEAIFHSVSAFCNAGFSLFPDSLMAYRADPVIVITVSALIISGGIGFLVLNELYTRIKLSMASNKQKKHHLSLHSRIVLSTTAWLIVSGFLLFFIFEWDVTMKNFSLSERILAALFQSVTPRTAGFNTLDFASMAPITIMGTMILMFIGGSPGSTAGGIKTSTITTLVAFGAARFTGRERASIFKRTIDDDCISKAFGVSSLGILIVILATACILVTELGTKPYGETNGLFVKYLFEVISAFGTVGLSMGVTPELGDSSKFILVLVMFVGRLGPLVVAAAVGPQPVTGKSFSYAEERIMIG